MSGLGSVPPQLLQYVAPADTRVLYGQSGHCTRGRVSLALDILGFGAGEAGRGTTGRGFGAGGAEGGTIVSSLGSVAPQTLQYVARAATRVLNGQFVH